MEEWRFVTVEYGEQFVAVVPQSTLLLKLYVETSILNIMVWQTVATALCARLITSIVSLDARSLLNYRGGTGPIVKAGVKCGKHQNLLTDCHSEEVGIHESDCDHSSDVGVMCGK